MNDSEVVEELRRAHGVHTVLLYGSYARGDATPQSDIDVAGFADVPATRRDARVWRGIFLDAFVYPTAVLEQPPELELLKLRGARVLLDERDLAVGLFERLAALELAGPPPPPEGHTEMLRVWAQKMLARIERDDVEAHYRRHWLLFQLLEDYFGLRGQWYRGPKLALADLLQHKPTIHAAFTAALAPDAPHEAIAALVAIVIA